MNILVDLTPLDDNFSGIERFTMNIALNLLHNDNDNEYILLFKNKVHDSFYEILSKDNIKYTVISGCRKLWFKQVRMLKVLYSTKADLYLFLAFPEPIFFFHKKVVTTIHDLGCWDCPDTMTKLGEIYFKISYLKSMRFSKQIITVSNFSKKRIRNIGHVKDNKIQVIYNGIDDTFFYKPDIDVLKKYGIPDNYILTLSTIEPRKNLKILLNAFSDLIHEGVNIPDLVLAGRKGWKVENLLSGYSNSVLDHIHFTGFIDDKDLPSIYSMARLFVFPSQYEGFGIPPLEAMACETAVVSSDAASLPEVLGDIPTYFENNNESDLKAKIVEQLDNEYSSTKNGVEWARRYDWNTQARLLQDSLCRLQ